MNLGIITLCTVWKIDFLDLLTITFNNVFFFLEKFSSLKINFKSVVDDGKGSLN